MANALQFNKLRKEFRATKSATIEEVFTGGFQKYFFV